jgi:hypothetical protein
LKAKQEVDRALWKRHVEYLDKFLKRPSHASEAVRLGIAHRLVRARKMLDNVETPAYVDKLKGTLGAEPISAYVKPAGGRETVSQSN